MAQGKGATVVVGIDFGTTYSGVSWASGDVRPEVITDWPASRASHARQEKVPSAISYDEAGNVEHWGYESTEMGRAERTLRWFKIMLESGSGPGNAKEEQDMKDIRQSIHDNLERIKKTPEDVVTDFLRVLWDHTREHIRKRVENESWEKTAVVVLAVPVVWSDLVKQTTLNSARKAGLGDCTILSEPEAAALSTLTEKSEGQALEVGDTFVVCDAGGGTVDLITYRVKELEPFEIEECAPGDGGLCGSVALDRGFECFIWDKIGETQYRSMKDRDRREQAVKRSFEWASTKSYEIRLNGVQDNPGGGIEKGCLELGSRALATIFDHVCQRIDRLVERQVNLCKEKAGRVTAILLVGGFGGSRYLDGRLEAKFGSDIRVQSVNGAWSAISRGATFHGQALASEQPPPVKTKIARGSYGFRLRDKHDERKHRKKHRTLGELTGSHMAQQIKWVIRRNDEIAHDAPPVRFNEVWRLKDRPKLTLWNELTPWNSQHEKKFTTELYYCTEDEPPLRMDHTVRKLGDIKCKVPLKKVMDSYVEVKPQGGESQFQCDLIVEIRANRAALEVYVLFKGERLGSVQLEYMES